MTQKILKVISILAILLFICTSYVAATGIDLNLPGTNQNPNQSTSNDMLNNSGNQGDITNNPNGSPNDMLNNPNGSLQNNMQNDLTNDQTVTDPFANNLPTTQTPTENLGATNVSNQETGLGMTNIINILLITVGVIIILLAIAIIIRLKG